MFGPRSYAPYILMFLLVIVIIIFATEDAHMRGFNELQVFLLRVAGVFSFPIGLILYLILRPAYEGTPQT